MPTKHATFDEEARKQLEDEGFCVISLVLTQDECVTALELAWDYVEVRSSLTLQNLRGEPSLFYVQAASAVQYSIESVNQNEPNPFVVLRDDPRTWIDGSWPRGVEGGILPYFGSGQSTCAWFVRSVPAVRAAFAALWREDDLIASMDGLLLWRPWRESGPGASPHARAAHRTEAGWFHVDQNPRRRPHFCSVQGLVRPPSRSARAGSLAAL